MRFNYRFRAKGVLVAKMSLFALGQRPHQQQPRKGLVDDVELHSVSSNSLSSTVVLVMLDNILATSGDGVDGGCDRHSLDEPQRRNYYFGEGVRQASSL